MNTDVKSIAYYLPQFHQIPENDGWWGEGFTEWTNVKKAIPIFPDHDQPNIPYEYYDLSDISVMYNQIEMAKKYSLHGFCFYYYNFDGKRLLEKPVEQFLNDKSEAANFPFMICWANENWTRRWDGADNEILIKQTYNRDNYEKLAMDFVRHFKDSRYIKDNGEPVLMIYRPQIITEFSMLVNCIRNQCANHGFPGVKIFASESFNFKNNCRFNIDGIIQFPPHHTFTGEPPVERKACEVVSYTDLVDLNLEFYKRYQDVTIPNSNLFYPCVFPSWDNTPRRGHAGRVYINHDINTFKKWLNGAKDFTLNYNKDAEKFIFINAWNEWAEGAYLEPDKKDGFLRLEALKTVMENK